MTADTVLNIALPDGSSHRFDRHFTIGRHLDCDIRVTDSVVSRRHAAVYQEDGQWWIQDRQSANGVLLNGQRVDRAILFGTGRIQLGAGGPILYFILETLPEKTTPPLPNEPPSAVVTPPMDH